MSTRTATGLASATTIVSVSAATAPSAGQVLTATGASTATWQTPAAPVGVSVRAEEGTPQTVTHSVDTAVVFDGTAWDDDAFWDVGTPAVLTVPTGKTGYYAMDACVRWRDGASHKCYIWIEVNGVEKTRVSTSDAGMRVLGIALNYLLDAGQTVELMVYLDEASDVDIESCHLTLNRTGV